MTNTNCSSWRDCATQIVPHVSAALHMSQFVFMQKDGHKTPLQCPYEGPFQVLDRSDKFITLQMNGKIDTVSIDPIKPAFLEIVCRDTDSGKPSSSLPSSTPLIVLQRTPSGWAVKTTEKLLSFVEQATGGGPCSSRPDIAVNPYQLTPNLIHKIVIISMNLNVLYNCWFSCC